MKLSLIFASLLVSTSALAGVVTVHDRANMLAPDDVATLQHEESQFDVHVLTEEAPSPEALANDAHNAVTGPNVMSIAIDPNHHKTSVRFGTATGVKSSDYDSIAAAGNLSFRQHHGREGIEAIMLRAQGSAQASVALVTDPVAPVVVQHGMSGSTEAFLVVLVLGFVGLAAWLFYGSRKDRKKYQSALDENRLETAELRSRNIEEADWASSITELPKPPKEFVPSPPVTVPQRRPAATFVAPAPVYVTQAPAPVVVKQSRSLTSDLATALVIEDLIDRDRRPTYVERETVYERDSGGSSSSWDSGSSSWGGDSGGSGSDWGGGGDSSW